MSDMASSLLDEAAVQKELRRILYNRHLENVFTEVQRRPGSAPPQVDDVPGSPLTNDFSGVFLGSTPPAISSLSHSPENSSLLLDLSAEERFRSDPAYVKYYYANKNINPRLPPPIMSRDHVRTIWLERQNILNNDAFRSDSQVIPDPSDNSDALGMLNMFGGHLSLKDSANAIPINDTGAASFLQQESFSSAWASANDALEELPFPYSPKNSLTASGLNSLLSQELKQQPASSLYVHADDSFQDSLFSSGSAPHTPRHSTSQVPVFDVPMSPRSSLDVPRSSTLGLGVTKDPTVALPGLLSGQYSQSGTPRAVERMPSRLSKSRVLGEGGSLDLQGGAGHLPSAVPGSLDAYQQLPPTNVSSQNFAGTMFDQSPLPGSLPQVNGLKQQHNVPGGDVPGLLTSQPLANGVPSPQQMHAMYMAAAMYPYYAQQGMNMQAAMQASAGLYPGFPMGFPGYPPYNPLLPMPYGAPLTNVADMPMRPPFPVPSAGGYPPSMMPFPPPEYAAYYQRIVEAQAAALAAAGGPAAAAAMAAAAMSNTGNGGGLGNAPSAEQNKDKEAQNVMGTSGGKGALDHQTGSGKRQSNSSDRGTRLSTVPKEAKRDASTTATPVVAASRTRVRGKEEVPAAPERRTDALLEEFKTNKNRKFDFKDIFGHIYEFSLDQHGSRFIQQKLEGVTPDELNVAFQEVVPKSLTLMTDVFGNYVIQKFFEHGSPDHRRQLAEVLKAHVLQLSLQMYGCRVIQKALEVLGVEQQCEIVAELDGHIMRCVRDQNGNHVIQKCIECVPTARIANIIDSFLGCVVPLSTHPFGCRVIQRILEHCQDLKKRTVVMDEILKATCQLAQDQYGNYVIQHVLEHGAPAERMEVVNKLAPQIVSMSLHKFASNVVEKCLTHCNSEERNVLIKEMLGEEGLENDPLQQMMKDQFGNYVVQKVLEVCNDVQREQLLSRVRAQLHALKKYTYGKHIVARVEKLLSTGTKFQTSAKSKAMEEAVESQQLDVEVTAT